MNLSPQEITHLIFLSEVVLEGKKRAMMPEMLQSMLYIVKSLRDVELSEDVCAEIRELISQVESRLKLENDRIQEIRHNLTYPNKRDPLEDR